MSHGATGSKIKSKVKHVTMAVPKIKSKVRYLVMSKSNSCCKQFEATTFHLQPSKTFFFACYSLKSFKFVFQAQLYCLLTHQRRGPIVLQCFAGDEAASGGCRLQGALPGLPCSPLRFPGGGCSRRGLTSPSPRPSPLRGAGEGATG